MRAHVASLLLITPPAIEPLTIAEVELHLRFDSANKEPAPDAPSVALANPVAPGNVDNGLHRWRFTFVTADGETDAGAISAAVVVNNKTVNGQVAVTNIPLGGSAVTARRLYRTVAGGSDYFLVATIPDNATVGYVDNVADVNLGVGIPVTNTTTDPLLSSLITAAREYVESVTHQALITQTWRASFDRFPHCDDVIALPITPLQSIASFTYVDASTGAAVPFAGYTTDVDAFPGRAVRNFNTVWPPSRHQRNAVVIDFVAGFGDTRADVPAPIRTAMKLLISSWYENRSEQSRAAAPTSVDALLAAYCRPAMEMA